MIRPPACLRDDDLQPTSLAQAWTLPADWYTSDELYAWEMERVFRPAWQLLGHTSRIREPGDYLSGQIAGAPVLAVRDRQAHLNTFYNVCRHRAGPVALGAGNCKLLRCRYHGWVYDLNGNLQHTPELGDAEQFDRDSFGLNDIASCEAGSLLFVRQADEGARPASDIGRIVTEILQRVGKGQLQQQKFYKHVSYRINCNWKVYIDNFLEGYHIPQVHPELAEVLDYRDYQTETFDGYSLQHSKIETATAAYNVGEAFYYFIFPNIMLNILPGRMQTNLVIPLGPTQCQVDFDYYYTDVSSADALNQIEEDLRFGDLVQQQDGVICEQVQCGLASGSYHRGRLSVAREAGVHHFQQCLRQAFRQAL